jgi:uncharacterized protein YegL
VAVRQSATVIGTSHVKTGTPCQDHYRYGAPTDQWRQAAARVKEGEQSKKFMFFAVGVQGANFGDEENPRAIVGNAVCAICVSGVPQR